MKILERHVLREHLLPFFLGFFAVTFVLTLDLLYQYLDLIITKGLPIAIVLQLFGLGLGWMIALSVPCGVLVASLMTFGRLSQDNEVLAMQAAGVNVLRILVLPLLAAGGVAVLLTLFNNHVLPESNHAFANLLLDISRKRPTVELREGVFLDQFDGYSLLIGRLDPRTGKMQNITLYDFSGGDVPVTILAKRGTVRYLEGGNTLELALEDGEIHEVPPDEGPHKYRRIRFTRHVIHIANVGATIERTTRDARSDREMSAAQLAEEIGKLAEVRTARLEVLERTVRSEGYASLAAFEKANHIRRKLPWWERIPSPLAVFGVFRAESVGHDLSRADSSRAVALPGGQPPALKTSDLAERVERGWLDVDDIDQRINTYRVEVHKKFSIPAACLAFVLVGAPLGMRARRSGIAVAFVSLAFFLFYYLCLIGGEELADRRFLPPVAAMWTPNVILAGLGIILLLKASGVRVPIPGKRARRPAETRA